MFTSVGAQNIEKMDTLKNTNLHFSLTARSALIFYPEKALNTFISPKLDYSVHENWSLYTGISFQTVSFNKMVFQNSETAQDKNLHHVSLITNFIGGSYRPSEKIEINAMVFNSTDISNFSTSQNNTRLFETNFKGLMMDVNYKISERTTLSIGLNYSNNANINNNQFSIFDNSFGLHRTSRFQTW